MLQPSFFDMKSGQFRDRLSSSKAEIVDNSVAKIIGKENMNA